MFTLVVQNENAEVVLVTSGEFDVTKDGLVPVNVEQVHLAAHATATVDTADTGRIEMVLEAPRIEPNSLPMQMTLTNPNESGVRVEYADMATGSLAELTIASNATETVTAGGDWHIVASLLGVDGEHAAPNDGFVEGNA